MSFHSWSTFLACLLLTAVTVQGAVQPTAEQLDAARRLESEPGTWSVEWDTLTGGPSAIEPRGGPYHGTRFGAGDRSAGRDPISLDQAGDAASRGSS